MTRMKVDELVKVAGGYRLAATQLDYKGFVRMPIDETLFDTLSIGDVIEVSFALVAQGVPVDVAEVTYEGAALGREQVFAEGTTDAREPQPPLGPQPIVDALDCPAAPQCTTEDDIPF